MTARRLWVPVVVALLVAALIGPGVVGAVEPRAGTHTITIPAGWLIANQETYDYYNNGAAVYTQSGEAIFTAPVPLPDGVATITKLTLFAWDNSSGYEVCANLYRTTPGTGSEDNMGGICSSGASTTNPRYFSTTTFAPAQVNSTWYGLYLWVTLSVPEASGHKFYGVRITYTN